MCLERCVLRPQSELFYFVFCLCPKAALMPINGLYVDVPMTRARDDIIHKVAGVR
jgi:hypothetical protein